MLELEKAAVVIRVLERSRYSSPDLSNAKKLHTLCTNLSDGPTKSRYAKDGLNSANRALANYVCELMETEKAVMANTVFADNLLDLLSRASGKRGWVESGEPRVAAQTA